MFSIARPDAFLLILLIIPTVLYSYYKFKKISHALRGLFPETSGNFDLNYARLRRTILLRSVFLALCWIFLSLAFARISFGTRNVPVQKSGNAVSMVFDISWSMTATDEKNGVSRLDAVKSYAGSLIDAMNGESISVVLAKGDGIIVVPLTEDMSAVDSVLESLSPSLMTSGGSSIGKGIEAAISTFPRNSAQNFHVWVFTDGDETDTEMKQSFDSAVKYGIPVTVIGFGSEQGQLIMSGDGITPVHTKLQAQKIREYAFEANRNSVIPQYGKSGMRSFIRYVEAGARGSAAELIDSLSDLRTAGRSSVDFAYEVQSVPRQGLFLLLAIVFFVLSIAANEFNLSRIKKRKTASLTMLVFMSLFMSGCTDNFGKSAKILSGTWNYYQKEYNDATADFYQTILECNAEKNEYILPYALYGLGSTYLMQEEYEAASSRLKSVDEGTHSDLLSVNYYNQGIIENKLGNYEEAIEHFKRAVICDERNLKARINLELTEQQLAASKAQSAEKQMTSVQEKKENSSLEQEVFNLIREEEQKKWKNIQSNSKNDAAIDY